MARQKAPLGQCQDCDAPAVAKGRCRRHYAAHRRRTVQQAAETTREHVRRREARRRGAPREAVRFTAQEVFERDGWVCQLCRQPVDPTLSRMDAYGATLDHILPVKYGGRDVWDNVQLAHRRCNMSKNATIPEGIGAEADITRSSLLAGGAPSMTVQLRDILLADTPPTIRTEPEQQLAQQALDGDEIAAEYLLWYASPHLLKWAARRANTEDALGFALLAFTEALHQVAAGEGPFLQAVTGRLQAHRWNPVVVYESARLTAPVGAWANYRRAMREANGDVDHAEALAAERYHLDPSLFRRLHAAVHIDSVDQVSEAETVPVSPSVPDRADVLLAEACLAQLTKLQREVIERMCGFVDRDTLPMVGYVSDRAISKKMDLPVGTVAALRTSALATMRAYTQQLLEET